MLSKFHDARTRDHPRSNAILFVFGKPIIGYRSNWRRPKKRGKCGRFCSGLRQPRYSPLIVSGSLKSSIHYMGYFSNVQLPSSHWLFQMFRCRVNILFVLISLYYHYSHTFVNGIIPGSGYARRGWINLLSILIRLLITLFYRKSMKTDKIYRASCYVHWCMMKFYQNIREH